MTSFRRVILNAPGLTEPLTFQHSPEAPWYQRFIPNYYEDIGNSLSGDPEVTAGPGDLRFNWVLTPQDRPEQLALFRRLVILQRTGQLGNVELTDLYEPIDEMELAFNNRIQVGDVFASAVAGINHAYFKCKVVLFLSNGAEPVYRGAGWNNFQLNLREII